MVTELNKLAELIALDSLPSWLRGQIESRKDEILSALQSEGVFVLEGPDGSRVEIRAKEKATAA